jgi:hypothetical protein
MDRRVNEIAVPVTATGALLTSRPEIESLRRNGNAKRREEEKPG